jgi:psiF repeat
MPTYKNTVASELAAAYTSHFLSKEARMSQHPRVRLILCSLALGTAVLSASAIAQTPPKPSTSGNVSQQDKMTACKNLAQKKNLSGNDEKTFIKDCMKQANPK